MTTSTLRRLTATTRPAINRSLLRRIVELASFGGVGAVAFVVDVGGYNLLRATIMPDQVIWSKVVSVSVAMIVAWLGHRYITFRGTRRKTVGRELVLFVVANGGGLFIAAACLYISHYIFGLTSPLADNISGNVVGLVLGTAFRYLAYRHIVFAPRKAPAA